MRKVTQEKAINEGKKCGASMSAQNGIDTKDAKLTLDQSQNLDAEPKAKLLRLTKGKNFVALKAFFFYDYEKNQKSVFLVFTEKPPEKFSSWFCTDSALKTIDAQMFFLFGIFENVLTKIIPDLWLLDLF